MMRYYVGPEEGNSRTIYDEHDGMPVLTVSPQGGIWTAERQATLDLILKTLNEP